MHRLLPLCLCFLVNFSFAAHSWQNAKMKKTAELEVYWYVSRPFIFPGQQDSMGGIEPEILKAFQEFLLNRHGIQLNVKWREPDSFYDVLQNIKNSTNPNALGISAFSITEERQQYVKFTQPYLPDITVLVSSQGTPIVHTFEEINRLMQDMTAITIKGAIYENMLLELKERLEIDFDIQYIDSNENVLDHISKTPNSFGFIDLPIYLLWIKNGSELVRQNFFTVRGTGYGFIMPLSSDWDEPFKEFLQDPEYQEKVAQIISKFIGPELYDFIGSLYEEELLGTTLLSKEKEIQLALIQNANLRLQEEQALKNVLIVGIVVVLVFLVVIGWAFVNNQRITKLIISQKEQIEAQRMDIQRKNDQLINRNAKLLAVNEERNHLMGILAHDLRAPLGHIMGLSDLLRKDADGITGESRTFVEHIHSAAKRMNQMTLKILDKKNLEGNREHVMREEVSISEIMRELEQRYNPEALKKDIELSIPTFDGGLTVHTDHLLLFLILENLLSNAIKFSSKHRKVSVSVQNDPDKIIFGIRDEGPGFTEEDKKMLFERFQPLSARPTNGEQSTGLGLSIVKKYVDDLGGEVTLESQHGQGSYFSVSIPKT